jgi:hypothetical protein
MMGSPDSESAQINATGDTHIIHFGRGVICDEINQYIIIYVKEMLMGINSFNWVIKWFMLLEMECLCGLYKKFIKTLHGVHMDSSTVSRAFYEFHMDSTQSLHKVCINSM